jgi:hypothetical protein
VQNAVLPTRCRIDDPGSWAADRLTVPEHFAFCAADFALPTLQCALYGSRRDSAQSEPRWVYVACQLFQPHLSCIMLLLSAGSCLPFLDAFRQPNHLETSICHPLRKRSRMGIGLLLLAICWSAFCRMLLVLLFMVSVYIRAHKMAVFDVIILSPTEIQVYFIPYRSTRHTQSPLSLLSIR